MKIIHCADLHLDARMTANLPKEKAAERKNELLATFNRLIDYAVEEDVDALIIAGDLFDTKRISAAAKNTVYQAIANHPGLAFYYLRGNHDADAFLSGLVEIPSNLHLFEKNWTTYIAGQIQYCGASWAGQCLRGEEGRGGDQSSRVEE